MGSKMKDCKRKPFPYISDLNQSRFHTVFTEAGVVLSKDLGKMQFLPAPDDRFWCSHGLRNEGALLGMALHIFRTCNPVPTAKLKFAILSQVTSGSISSLTPHTSPGSCSAVRPACTGATPLQNRSFLFPRNAAPFLFTVLKHQS